MELGTEDQGETRPAKRSRVLVACERCKGRRQKCDNAAPACSNCARSNAACNYKQYPTTYVVQLEERVGQLEAQLRSGSSCQPDARLADNSMHTIEDSPSVPSHEQPRKTAIPSAPLASGIGLLSACAAAEPHYFGFSSGLTLAHFVEAALVSGDAATEVNLPSLADRPFSKQVPTAQTKAAPVPPHSTGARFVKAYFAAIHPLYPFVDQEDLWVHHRHAMEKTQPPYGPLTAGDLARLHLIYAIGARCIQLLEPRKVQKHDPESHLVSAMQSLPEALKTTSLRTIEVTLLLAIHSMRSPSGASVWHLCGLAVRQCLELGLHRPKSLNPSRLEQHRRRLFWSAYIFERKSALVLGRPFTISDKDIETPLPVDLGDVNSSPEPLTGDAMRHSAQMSTVTLHRHYILLYRIHGKIRSALHHLKKEPSDGKVRAKIAACFTRLEEWRSTAMLELDSCTVPSHAPPSPQASQTHSDSPESVCDVQTPLSRSVNLDKTELLLEYHKACRSLLQPLLTEGGSMAPLLPSDFSNCADASGQICHLYRKLHRLSALPFTLRDLHAVFVAGFTTIYCMFARPELYDARRAGEIGACSTILYVIAEQWPSAKRYRDAFEAVADNVASVVDKRLRGHSIGNDERNPGKGILGDAQHARNVLLIPRIVVNPAEKATGNSDAGRWDAGALQDGEHASDMLSSGLLADPYPSSDIDYGSSDIRELLVHEGLDWFSDPQWW